MQAEEIAKTLGNAKKVNGQWVASCPVPGHGRGNGDKNPSLSISDGDDGRPIFHCHGGEPIEVRGCDLFEFADGKISRKDSFWKIVD